MSVAVAVGSGAPRPVQPLQALPLILIAFSTAHRGARHMEGPGVTPDFPEAGRPYPLSSAEPAAALEPQVAARGLPPQSGAGGRRGNCFFIQDDDSGEEPASRGCPTRTFTSFTAPHLPLWSHQAE